MRIWKNVWQEGTRWKAIGARPQMLFCDAASLENLNENPFLTLRAAGAIAATLASAVTAGAAGDGGAAANDAFSPPRHQVIHHPLTTYPAS